MHPQLLRLCNVGSKLAAFVAPIAALLTRLVIGYAFVQSGWGKWHNLERTTEFFATLGIPAPKANAIFIATVELVGGSALILGLGTRVFAALLSATMVVALMTADKADFFAALHGVDDKGLTDVVPFAFLMFLLWLVGFGAGPLSVDRLLAKKAPPGST